MKEIGGSCRKQVTAKCCEGLPTNLGGLGGSFPRGRESMLGGAGKKVRGVKKHVGVSQQYVAGTCGDSIWDVESACCLEDSVRAKDHNIQALKQVWGAALSPDVLCCPSACPHSRLPEKLLQSAEELEGRLQPSGSPQGCPLY